MTEIEICELICNSLRRPTTINRCENYQKKLTGEPFYLTSIELFYLFNKIEEYYEIKIEASDLLSGKFNSISGIVSIIQTL